MPLILGHEIVGKVTAGRWAGRAVIVDPTIACGTCVACVRGYQNVCENLRILGIDRDGGLSDSITVAESKLHLVPESLPLTSAAMVEPLSVAVHAAARTGPYLGARVVIMGAGPVGLLTALVVRAAGALSVVIVEPGERRRGAAEQLGFATTSTVDLLPETLRGELADLVFDAAGAPEVALSVTGLVRPRGSVVFEGVYGRPVPLDLQAVTFGELNLVGTRVYTPMDIDTALALLTAGSVDVTSLVSEVVEFAGVSDALGRLERGESVKVLVRCRGKD
jgi:2-desacetyl-2-hydroxyethyl bacteriochlorophyllide A dehydrogenase